MFRFFLCLLLLSNMAIAQQKKEITLEDIWQKNTFRIKTVPGFNALKDGSRYTQIDKENGSQQIRIYDLKTGKAGEVLFNAADHLYEGKALPVVDYSFSDDEKKLLLFTERQQVYRHSSLEKVYVFDLAKNELQLLNDAKVMHATFSPDGKMVAYVQDNNLFYKNLVSGARIPVTTDGQKNEIINGNCDWVYEEEFSFTKAFEWAPDSRHLAFYKFDERGVKEYTMTMYDSLYPTPYKYKYPKAGEANSVVSIYLFDLAKQQNVMAGLEALNASKDYYIPRIKWTKNPAQLCIFKLNRHQNHLRLFLANAATGKTILIYDERNKYYIDITDNLQFLTDNLSFIFSSEQHGFHQFYRYNWKRDELTALTKGSYDIDALVGVDEKNGLMYYTAAVASPLERKLYSVDLNGKKRRTLTPENGTHVITPIEGFNYFLDKFSTLTSPPVYSLIDNKGNVIRTLEDNHQLAKTMEEYDLGKISFRTFYGKDNVPLNGWMIKPPHFDKDRKYPVLMYQYSGPGSQEVADRFPLRDFFWHQMLAQKGYIIVCVDGTGTGFRGEDFKKKTYLQLGKLESDDQIAVAKSLAALPYVDASRIGIWGWSFGGFMSATCIFKAPDVFRTAISVAPVTNWRYYDNIYTERYMRTPAENASGYDDNAPEKMVQGLKGNFLLIHGTGDDNVHFQNSASLVNELIRANKEFDSEYYPNRAHGISGGNTRYHLYHKMTNFILQYL